MFELLINPVSDLLTEVFKRVLPPEKMSEKERAEAETQLRLALMQADWTKVEKEFEDRMSARLLAEKELEKGNAFTNMLAAVHRPLWSLTCLLLFAWIVLGPQFGLPPLALPPLVETVYITVIQFYFGGRTLEKIVSMAAPVLAGGRK